MDIPKEITPQMYKNLKKYIVIFRSINCDENTGLDLHQLSDMTLLEYIDPFGKPFKDITLSVTSTSIFQQDYDLSLNSLTYDVSKFKRDGRNLDAEYSEILSIAEAKMQKLLNKIEALNDWENCKGYSHRGVTYAKREQTTFRKEVKALKLFINQKH